MAGLSLSIIASATAQAAAPRLTGFDYICDMNPTVIFEVAVDYKAGSESIKGTHFATPARTRSIHRTDPQGSICVVEKRSGQLAWLFGIDGRVEVV